MMLILLRHGNVKPKNKKAMRKLLLYFGDVTDIQPTAIRWDGLKFHRNNASYRILIGISGFADRLYQRFVLSYYQQHHPNYAPRAAYIEWNLWDDADRTYLPAMQTDITLTSGNKQLIIDTKYYGHTMQVNSRFNRTTFISGNIYQIYTYVKNSDKGVNGNVAGVLLYATTDEAITPDDDFNIGGNRISLNP